MSPETLISMIAAKGLEFGYVPGGGRPEWTSQDAAMACHGLAPRIFASLCFTYAGDESKFWLLLTELQSWATYQVRCEMREAAAYWANRESKTQQAESSPRRLWTHEATADIGSLAEMWLLEVKQPWRFARQENAPTPDLRRVIIGVDQKTWQRRYSPAYEAMGQEFNTWLDIGAGRMRKWLRRDVSICASD